MEQIGICAPTSKASAYHKSDWQYPRIYAKLIRQAPNQSLEVSIGPASQNLQPRPCQDGAELHLNGLKTVAQTSETNVRYDVCILGPTV